MDQHRNSREKLGETSSFNGQDRVVKVTARGFAARARGVNSDHSFCGVDHTRVQVQLSYSAIFRGSVRRHEGPGVAGFTPDWTIKTRRRVKSNPE